MHLKHNTDVEPSLNAMWLSAMSRKYKSGFSCAAVWPKHSAPDVFMLLPYIRPLSHCCTVGWPQRGCTPGFREVYPWFPIDFPSWFAFLARFLKAQQRWNMQAFQCTFRAPKIWDIIESLWKTVDNPHENRGYTRAVANPQNNSVKVANVGPVYMLLICPFPMDR